MGLIVSSADGQEATFTFAYNLVRQTLLARISVPRRQLLHLRAAEALALAHPKAMSQHAVATAHHVELVGALAENQRLVRSLRLAGKSALATAAPAPS
jgi:uncharacterized protein (TIGR04206 family)